MSRVHLVPPKRARFVPSSERYGKNWHPELFPLHPERIRRIWTEIERSDFLNPLDEHLVVDPLWSKGVVLREVQCVLCGKSFPTARNPDLLREGMNERFRVPIIVCELCWLKKDLTTRNVRETLITFLREKERLQLHV